ncbi:CynX/NimT family MFS transporter [Nocardiopsis sp. MG754419]|uniref:MFS transporter n=1 Tax=Nocardiopsis sp. MG754419 TaxID=2259865 RepID=UPI001BA5F22A|nr:MFS transporter [Nocardiopsis sp. MG754419]MBR8740932.1 MFS transporter [Nocardiopsis sp. MG754419]
MRPSSPTAVTDRPSVRPATRGRVLALVAIVCAALNLRLVVTSLSPLLTTVGDAFGFTATVVGVFGTLPLVAFAIFGLITPAVMRRLGAEATAALSMLLTGVGQVLRAFAPDTGTLLALTGVALTGAALGNVVLPPLIKQYFPDRLAALSTVQMVAIHLGALFPPLVAIPLAEVAGWRVALGAWAGIALVAAVLWTVQWRVRGTVAAPVGAAAIQRPLARPIRTVGMAWRMALLFGMVTWNVFTLFTWLPALLSDAGHSPAAAGGMVSLMVGTSLLFGLVAPAVTLRAANTFPIVVLGLSGYGIGYLGVALAPQLAVVWVLFLGLGTSLFVVTMTMINARSATPQGAAALSGFVQGAGSGIALGGPLLFGLLGELTGGWTASYVVIAGGSLVVAVVVAYVERTPWTIEAAAQGRHPRRRRSELLHD